MAIRGLANPVANVHELEDVLSLDPQKWPWAAEMPCTVRSSRAAIAVHSGPVRFTALATLALGVPLVLSVRNPPMLPFATACSRIFPVDAVEGFAAPDPAKPATTQLLASWIVTLMVAGVLEFVASVAAFPRLKTPEYEATATTISVPVQQFTFAWTHVLSFDSPGSVEYTRTLDDVPLAVTSARSV